MGESAKSILSGGIEELKLLRQKIEQQEALEKKIEQMEADCTTLEAEARAEEKRMNDRIEEAVKSGRQEVTSVYGRQLEKAHKDLKSVRDKREKEKEKGIKQRIQEETKELCQKNEALKEDMKQVFKQNGVPFFCNAKWFYALYYPNRMVEGLGVFLYLIIGYLGIPWLFTFVIIDPPKAFMKVLLDLVLMAIVFGGYYAVRVATKGKHDQILRQYRIVQNQIANNECEIRRIKKKIRKDPDESIYGLHKYDTKIKVINDEIRQITENQTHALEQFESETKPVIIQEFSGESQKKIRDLEEQAQAMAARQKIEKESYKKISEAIASEYAVYLGSEFIDVQRISELISLIENGSAKNVQEAKAAYLIKAEERTTKKAYEKTF